MKGNPRFYWNSGWTFRIKLRIIRLSVSMLEPEERGCPMRKISVDEINQELQREGAGFAERVDADFRAQIRAIAEDVRAHAQERPMILISGPSGSGKTTSAKMLESMLDSWGCETHTLSMDNYFKPFTAEELKLVEQGKVDLESPDRLDIPFMNQQLADIAACRPVELPKYDFANSTRVPLGQTLCRKPGELVIVEGIHSLNPEVISLPEDQSCRIYVSVRTRVTVGNQTLHPAFIRLLRRMLRDKAGRARSYAETIRMFESVQRGESRYIMPYKHRSTYDVDTFHDYELCAYKTLCTENLAQLSGMPEMRTLEAVLEALEPLQECQVPPAALVREFVGNSLFTD